MTARKIVFSGIQPTGDFHLGNYIGAVKRWVADQALHDNIFCIVDLHAITLYQDPNVLRAKIRQAAGVLLACGIDPQKSLLFVQSQVSAHPELTWLLNCVTPIGWLERMTQYKDKAAKQESVSTGLLDYPVLMASDILLYQTDYVPVGEDQKQHIELTRDIAQRFNNLYGETFALPEGIFPKVGARIMGLDDPTVKMSKSIATDQKHHAVGLLDSPDQVWSVLKRATTDSGKEIVFSDAPSKAGVNNLLTIYQALTGQTQIEIEKHFEGKLYGALKREVADVIIETLAPIQTRYNELMQDARALDAILQSSAEQAAARAAPTLRKAKEHMGFV
ncbi:MAG: tryptophan--tRNA ligase [Chloroflexi bacterium UTCFX4]|jgi:tryptophanyl-tRNA synthetase|nr:MAG: tryptophan--tRNA ligase [Chloroflexi bacterium UTCFX4]